MKKYYYLLVFIFFFLFTSKAEAANLTQVKDTITTSRPSAASPLSGDTAASAGIVTIYNNKSVFLASDSAKIVKSDASYLTTGLNVASQSADLTKVYLTNNIGGTKGDGGTMTLINPITAKHTIQFTTTTSVPATGDIKITFSPGGTNQASPSATGFAFNGLVSGNISISGATCNTWAAIDTTNGIITCSDVNAVAGATTVTITLGSSTPALINPTKTANAGTADTWGVTVSTYDASGIALDSTKVKIGTIESVLVQAVVEPTLTFTIAGINSGTNINSNNSGCADPSTAALKTTNSGINATTTVADLGILNNGAVTMAGQDLTISTNMNNGYVLTATSSGQLTDPATGYRIANAQGPVTNNGVPVPAAMAAGTEAFGIHACGADVTTATWGTRATDASTVLFANPSASFYYTLASHATAVSSAKTTVVYGGTISTTTPPGLYITVLTYVATPMF